MPGSSKRMASNAVDSAQSSQPAKKTRRAFRIAKDPNAPRNVSAKTVKHLASGHLSARRVQVGENVQLKSTSELNEPVDMGDGGSSMSMGGGHPLQLPPPADSANGQAVSVPEGELIAAPVKTKRKRRVNTTSVSTPTANSNIF